MNHELYRLEEVTQAIKNTFVNTPFYTKFIFFASLLVMLLESVIEMGDYFTNSTESSIYSFQSNYSN